MCDGIYRAIGERWDKYSVGCEVVYIKRWLKDGIYTAMGCRDGIFIHRSVREMGYLKRWVRDGIFTANDEKLDIYLFRLRYGIRIPIGERCYIYSNRWDVGYIQGRLREMEYI